jgi:hypothetical protein
MNIVSLECLDIRYDQYQSEYHRTCCNTCNDYVETFKTAVILYEMFMDNCCTKMYYIYQVLVSKIVRYHICEIMMNNV